MTEVVRPQYLRVRNWEKFQHYKDRRPPWIKYLVELLDDHELLSLPPLTQLVYDRLLLLAAVTDNNIPNDHAWIAGKTLLKRTVIADAVETLIVAGFLSLSGSKRAASKGIARRRLSRTPAQSQETETETETEEQAETEAKAELPQVQSPRAVPNPRDAQPIFKTPTLKEIA